ncbi:MAG: ribose 5-phosphate isomerase B [Archangium gephyra]|uniref:Ribose 5-phosphate isomerase B n=1 Tax=Archangium gephyra TaxID=48 RepID=A0A2W5TM44_9BACT|nr:MAG: ribose 5-phosphate isomerase B [Archangium gephyra]
MANIAIASDHAGFALKSELVAELGRLGHTALDFGPTDTSSVDYPDFATRVTAAINEGKAPLGVLVCGTGIGMSISANKVHGIRAALCHTEFEARVTRQHNDANVLCLGQRVTGVGVALEILKVFLSASFEGGRHANRVSKITALEAKR